MAETAVIYRLYGAGGTKYSLLNKIGRFCSQDSDPGLNNPCKVPPTGSVYYSMWVTDCIYISGDFNQARDIYIHGDGRFASDWGLDAPNGGGLFVGYVAGGESGLPIDVTLHGRNQYAQATGETGKTGNFIGDTNNGHPYYRSRATPVINFDTCQADSRLLIDSGPYTDDFYSKAWVMQIAVVPTSTYGAKTPKSVIVTYNIF